MSEQMFIEDHLKKAREFFKDGDGISDEDKGNAEYHIMQVLEYFPKNAEALYFLQELCKERMIVYIVNFCGSIRGSSADMPEWLWDDICPYYRKFINAALTIIREYPGDFTHQEDELLEYVFINEYLGEKIQIIDPYQYFLEEVAEDRMTFKNVIKFYELLISKKWDDAFIEYKSRYKEIILTQREKYVSFSDQIKGLTNAVDELIWGERLSETQYCNVKVRIEAINVGERGKENGNIWIDRQEIALEPIQFRVLLYLAWATKLTEQTDNPRDRLVTANKLEEIAFYNWEDEQKTPRRKNIEKNEISIIISKIRGAIDNAEVSNKGDHIIRGGLRFGYWWFNVSHKNIKFELFEEDIDLDMLFQDKSNI